MKYSMFRYAMVLILSVFLVSFSQTTYNDSEKDKVLMSIISQSLMKAHYLPQKIDDRFSEKVFSLFIDRLDSRKRFFTQKDIDEIKKYNHLIDDEINNSSYEFFDILEQKINTRITEAENYYKEILANPFDFIMNENIELDADKIIFAANTTEIKDYWRKFLKYETITHLYDLQKKQDKAIEKNDTTVDILSFEELEAKARKKILKKYESSFHNMSKLKRKDRLQVYLNSITGIYDPHTTFFPPKEKKQFDIDMSGQLEGIGATLTDKDGYITITSIIPGSACWRQGELKEGDVILKVAQGDEEPVDIIDMRLDNAVQLIRGKKGTEVRLTVKKKVDESIEVISIIRDVVKIEATYARSAVLSEEKNKEKFGYIYLPKFYVDFKNVNGPNCARDMKNEIKKLKEENIDGLIVDLRNNTGGSLPYVVDIAGLFIKDGPIVQVKSRIGKPSVYSDTDSEIQYDGPLVIMVNSFSASASEILAAAMQDYNRAVIIGSTSTYGKGTVQRFLDFDSFLPADLEEMKPMGALKVTMQKFYRVNGGATQLKGVIPDIILPDSYTYLDVGEKEYDYAMNWDEIAPLDYTDWKTSYSIDKLRKSSVSRIKKNETFKLIAKNAKRIHEQKEETIYPLNFEKYTAFKKKQKKEADKYKKIGKDNLGLLIETPLMDAPTNQLDSIKWDKEQSWHKSIRKDIYIKEAFSVLDDMVD